MPLPLNNFPVEYTIFPQDSISIIQNLIVPNIVIEDYEKTQMLFILILSNLFACLTKICALILKFGNFNKAYHIVKHYVSILPGTYCVLSKYKIVYDFFNV